MFCLYCFLPTASKLNKLKLQYEPRHEKNRFLPKRKQGADQRRCFRYLDSTFIQSLFFLNPNFQASSPFLRLYGRFVLDLVENPDDPFSRVAARISVKTHKLYFETAREMTIKASSRELLTERPHSKKKKKSLAGPV